MPGLRPWELVDLTSRELIEVVDAANALRVQRQTAALNVAAQEAADRRSGGGRA